MEDREALQEALFVLNCFKHFLEGLLFVMENMLVEVEPYVLSGKYLRIPSYHNLVHHVQAVPSFAEAVTIRERLDLEVSIILVFSIARYKNCTSNLLRATDEEKATLAVLGYRF